LPRCVAKSDESAGFGRRQFDFSDQLGKQRANELSSIPTRFKMAPETVELVIEAGRDAVRTNPTFQAFL
jgi:hypothetical protein